MTISFNGKRVILGAWLLVCLVCVANYYLGIFAFGRFAKLAMILSIICLIFSAALCGAYIDRSPRTSRPKAQKRVTAFLSAIRASNPKPISPINNLLKNTLGYFSRGVQMGQSAALYCRMSTADQSCAQSPTRMTSTSTSALRRMVRRRFSSSSLEIGPMRIRCQVSLSTETFCTLDSMPWRASWARMRSASAKFL